ncbi:hypothetical protein AX14_005116 [Amanita brunnescens Koide BX004]|nr:hypothetical protein AX14_005116 [Amanita brunnescens Koide BX004]
MVNRLHIGPYLPTHRLTGEHGDSVICLAFSANGRYLASGSDDATLVIWRVEDGIKLSSFRLDSPVLSLVWDSHRENRLFVGCLDGTAGFIDKFKGEIVPLLTGLCYTPVYALAVDPFTQPCWIAIGAGPEVHIAIAINQTGDSWTTMRRKSPSSSTKPPSRAPLPSKTLSPLASPSLSSLPRDPLLPPALSASPSGTRASPVSPDNLWDDYPDSHWEVDNDIYCDSMGCSYDVNKNPRLATVTATVIEFNDCSYQEYEDTLFLCKICNISCRRSINKSKIKSKMPLEDFLRHQRTEDDSFSPEAIGLPLPPPSAADFPPLAPRAPNPGSAPKKPTPKLTRAEKATQGKINALLAPAIPDVRPAAKHHKAGRPASADKTPEPPARKILERPVAKTSPEQTDKPSALASPAPSPVPNVVHPRSPPSSPSLPFR